MNRRTRHITIVGITLVILVSLGILGWRLLRSQDETWARLQRGGTLRVAVDPSFPPFDDVDETGQLEGFDIDLARELSVRLGVPVEFKAIAFDGLVDAVLANKADMVISAFPLDPRLTNDVRYSRPYFEGGLVLVVRKDSDVMGPEGLVGHKVAAEWGSLGDAWARAAGLDIVRQETPDDALAAVVAGSAEAALVDAVTYAESIVPGLIFRTPPLESDPYVIVLPLNAPKLSEQIDQALAELMADGSWDRLVEEHFPAKPPQPLQPDTENKDGK